MRRVVTAVGLLVLLLTGSAGAGVLAGAPAAAADDGAASSGPAVWKRYDVKITRGSWQQVGVHTLPKGSTWTVSLR